MGLISDLFPRISIDSKIDHELTEAVTTETLLAGLQAEEGFVKKCVNMKEIIEVRHSIFIIGTTGNAKTKVWQILAKAEKRLGRDSIYEIIDPKAVSSDELFGFMNPKTKEWKDGVLSVIMRNMNRCNPPFKETHENKWIVLDGDIDPEWIESCNTVMDDNKVLTLVSQERIPLTNSMRLVLEVSNLRNATPATVSRGGVLFINDNDVGYSPFINSWMDQFKKGGKNEDEVARTVFDLCFRNFLSDNFLDNIRTSETVAPMVTISYIQSLTCIINYLYKDAKENKEKLEFIRNLRQNGPEDQLKQIFEAMFIYALMWSFGAALTNIEKIKFSNSLKSNCKNIKFPESKDLCFNFFFDLVDTKFVNWQQEVHPYKYEESELFDNIVVPTTETVKNQFLLDLHVSQCKPILFVGNAGTAKTTFVKDYFKTLDKERFNFASINFNSYTDSFSLQQIMLSHIDKRTRTTWGPPTNTKLIYFMDDLNMPKVDKYGTQSPIALMR